MYHIPYLAASVYDVNISMTIVTTRFPYFKDDFRLIRLKNDISYTDKDDLRVHFLSEELWIRFEDVYSWIIWNWKSPMVPAKFNIQRDLMCSEGIKCYAVIDMGCDKWISVVRVTAFLKYILTHRFKEDAYNNGWNGPFVGL